MRTLRCFPLAALLTAALALLTACGGDGDGPRASPSGPTTPTATEIGTPSGSTAPCTATVVLQNGNTVVVSGSPGASVVAGNVTINFTQRCDFSTTMTIPEAAAA